MARVHSPMTRDVSRNPMGKITVTWTLESASYAHIHSHSRKSSDTPPINRNVMTMPLFSWRNSICFLFQNALSSNWQLFHFVILMAHYHLTSPAVCPHIHPPDLFVLPLKNFWPSQGSTWKVLVHDLFKIRLHSFGNHYLWKSASARLSRLLNSN